MKFQSLVTPDGLLSHVFGPVAGSRHDMHMWALSGLEEILSSHAFNDYCVFGDQGYQDTGHLRAPIPGIYLELQERQFNERMLPHRLTVEWGFMLVSQSWQLFQRPAFLRIRNTLTTDLYLLAILLTNLKTCYQGRNIISDHFHCPPCSPRVLLGLDPP